MDSGTISALVAVIGLALTYFGAGIDPTLITGAVQGVFAVVSFVAAVWSWWSHRQKNATMVAAGLR